MILLPTELLAARFKLGGDDPKTGIDCWGVVKYVYRHAGHPAPDLPELVGSASNQVRCFEKLNPKWRQVAWPGEPLKELDLVISLQREEAPHCGVVIDAARSKVMSAHDPTGPHIISIYYVRSLQGVYRRISE